MNPTHVKLSGSVPGGVLKALHLRAADLHDELGAPSVARLSLETEDPNLSPDDMLGKTLCLTWDTHSGKRHHHGVVWQVQQDNDSTDGGSVLQVELQSWLTLLSGTQDFRIHQHQSVIDIVQAVFARHGRTGSDYDLSGLSKSYPPKTYCVQYGETDLQFVMRLLEQEGIYVWIKHSAGNHTVVLCDNPGVHQPFPGYAELPYSPNQTWGNESQREFVSAAGVQKSICAPRHVQRDYYFKTPLDTLEVKHNGPQKPYNSQYEHFVYPGEYTHRGEGQNLVQLQQEREQAREKVCTGAARAHGVVAGYVLKLTNHNLNELQCPWLMVKTTLHLTLPPRKAVSGGAAHMRCEFEAVPHATPFRPALRTPKPRAGGLALARVVGPPGEEIHTDEFGRVRVYFFWDRHVEKMEEASCWMRVSHPLAGKGFGWNALPRVGQEVLVAFEYEDPDRPLVVGRVHNTDQPVPYPLSAQKTVSGIKTRSTVGGSPAQFNELRFEDKIGQEYVWLQAERDYHFLTKNHRNEEVGGNYHLLVRGNRVETVLGTDSVHRTGGEAQRIDGACSTWVNKEWVLHTQSDASFSARGDLVHHTQSSYSLQASQDMQVKSGTNIQVQAGTTIVLQAGGCSITIGPSGIYLNGPVSQGGGMPGAHPKLPDPTKNLEPGTSKPSPVDDPLGP